MPLVDSSPEFAVSLSRLVASLRIPSRTRRRGWAVGHRLCLQTLEDRTTPSLTATVTNDTDKTPGDPRGDPGSFRAILDQVLFAGGGTINFAPNVKTITFTGPLGFINEPVTINGLGVTMVFPAKALETTGGGPIEAGLLFTNSGNVVDGLTVVGSSVRSNGLDFSDPFAPQGSTANNNQVIGVTVYGFGGAQLAFGGNNNVVQNNFLGTDGTGTKAKGGSIGLYLTGSGDTIGGASADEGNVISGLKEYGVFVAGPTATNNTLRRNEIGTDFTGKKGLGNTWSGVHISTGATNNHLIQNVISANHIDGIDISDVGTTGNTIEGNFIGTTVDGKVALGNKRDGVEIYGGATDNTIGGAVNSVGKPGGGNVISGNTEDGVSIYDSDANVTADNQVLGNYIGVDVSGSDPVPNERHGVGLFDGTSANVIGKSGDGNVIAANKADGIFIGPDSTTDGPTQTKVQGNYVGTNPSMDETLGNGFHGISVNGSQTVIGADVGSTDKTLGNYIAFSGQQDESQGDGVVVMAGHLNTIRLNHIFKNKRLGIDLNNDYFDKYNPNPVTGGANNGQWHPTIISVNGPTIVWMLNAAPDTHYTVDVYSDPANDYTEYAEGQDPEGSPIDVTTDATGHAEFSTSVGSSKITATATDDNGNTSEFSLADEDGDGLCDTWETSTGIDLTGDGSPELVLDGANPHHKDLYVEVDAMTGFAPVPGVLDTVTAAFARVPNALVNNPDGQDGITLHAQLSTVGIPAEDVFTNTPNSGLWATDWWQAFHNIKDRYFGPSGINTPAGEARLLAYRYCLFADTFGNPNTNSNTYWASGNTENFRSNDFMVTLGSRSGNFPDTNHGNVITHFLGFSDAPPVVSLPGIQAGTFMHELGHTLGLSHIGPTVWGQVVDGPPNVNYHSVMTYAHQLPMSVGGQILDYSHAGPNDWSTPPAPNQPGLWFAFQESPGSQNGAPPDDVDANDLPPLPNIPATDTDVFTYASGPINSVPIGTVVPVTFSVCNDGPATATAATFSATLPAGVTVVSATADHGTVTVNGQAVTATLGDITHARAATITVKVSVSQPGSYDLTGTAATTATDAVVGNESATYTLASEYDAQVAPPVGGRVGVFGTRGADTILLSPTKDRASLQVTINKKVVSKIIPLAGLTQINVSGKAGNDSITVTNLGVPVQIDGGPSADLITLNPATATNQVAPVTFANDDGRDRVVVNGSKAVGNAFILNGNSLTLNGGVVTLGSPAGLTLVGQRKSDSLTVTAAPAFPLAFNGGGGTDTLVGSDVGNTWHVTKPNAGTLTSAGGTPVQFSAVENLTGGTGPDSFVFANGKKVSGVIDGKAGGGVLDFSAWTGPVTVDLSAAVGKCSGAGKGVSGSFSTIVGGGGADRLTAGAADTTLIGNGGNDSLTGGAGNDVLIGGAGNDILTDAAGTNVLVGGDGAEQLVGGGGNDLMIGGRTTVESDPTGLAAVLAEWTSGDSYSTKVSTLSAGGLNVDTVADDFAKDALTGLAKGGDWFVVSALDTNDAAAGETVTTI